MKKLILLITFILITGISYAQKYYVSVAPSLAFDTSIKRYNDAIGGGVEVGKNYENYSVGVSVNTWDLNKNDIYSALAMYIPISNSNFTISGNIGWFYYYKDITVGYGVGYNINLDNNTSVILTFGTQSAFESTIKYLSVGYCKTF
jgi:hypothetical protein